MDKAEKNKQAAKWREHSLIFLTPCLLEAEDEVAKKKLPKKVERLSSFYLCHACDWQLQGQGLSGYVWYVPVSVGPELSIETRPLLIENMDSGSQNVCKAFYLLSQKKSRVLPIWDAFHKRWDMTLGAYKSVGLWASIKLMSITFEVKRGPFKGFAFFIQQLGAMRGYLDLGEAKWLHKLGPKTAPSRWFNFHDAVAFFEPHNTERLAGMCFLGIQQGWFKGKDSTKGLMKALTPGSEKKDNERKTGTAEATERESRMRDRCANSLHLSAAILADRDIRFHCKLACFISAPPPPPNALGTSIGAIP